MTLWRELVDNRLANLHDPTEDKLTDLASAVRSHVRPGMTFNPCAMQARPNAILYELCRQFAGKDPGFEYVGTGIGSSALSLIHLNLLRKVSVAFAGESYPTPGPSPVVKRAVERGALEIENWSMLTVPERFLAGAMGVPYLATRSLAGSSIGEELKPGKKFIEMDNPAEPGASMGLLQACRPDICFVHAWAADRAGNAICFPPFGENAYGPLAAKEGVILTADHIVDTDFIRKYANLVRIPASIVRTVSHVPYGAHPSGNFNQNVDDFRPYGNDYDFMIDCRKATKQEDNFTAWCDEWILGVKDHAEYVKKLGEERIEHLHWVAEANTWRDELEQHAETLSDERPAGPVEVMIVHAARAVADRIRKNEYKTCLSGVGQATLMAWLAAHELRKEGIDFAMMSETGIIGHDPRPSDPFVFNFRNLHATTVLTDIFETLGLHTGGAANRCIGTIGAAQIDKHGNVNSTRSADGMHIVGSGGANDITSAACETVVVAQQRRQTFVDKVNYITSPGKHIQCVVSTMGRFEKRGGGEFVLTGYIPEEGYSKDEVVNEIKNRVGWDLQIANDLEELSPPTDEELALLRMFDPQRYFLGKPAERVGAGKEAAPAK